MSKDGDGGNVEYEAFKDDEDYDGPELDIHQEGTSKKILDCGKSFAKKRGRKSLLELWVKDGDTGGQTKIKSMLSQGKGKHLPQEK